MRYLNIIVKIYNIQYLITISVTPLTLSTSFWVTNTETVIETLGVNFYMKYIYNYFKNIIENSLDRVSNFSWIVFNLSLKNIFANYIESGRGC